VSAIKVSSSLFHDHSTNTYNIQYIFTRRCVRPPLLDHQTLYYLSVVQPRLSFIAILEWTGSNHGYTLQSCVHRCRKCETLNTKSLIDANPTSAGLCASHILLLDLGSHTEQLTVGTQGFTALHHHSAVSS